MLTNTLQIFAKELRSYFQSRMAWFIFVVYALLSMAVTFFQSRFITLPEPGLLSFFRLQADIFTLIIPALTIKLWTDEKRLGTLELTLSLPVSYTALTLGKFLSVWILCGLMLLSTCGLWISASWLTEIDNAAVLQNYLSCWLLCGALCAVSMSAASFTAHPVSAFVVSFAVCLGLSLLNFAWLVGQLGFSSEALLRAGSALNFSGRFNGLIAGQISAGTIFYYLSLIFFALWLNVAAIGWRSKKNGLFTAFCLSLLFSFAALNIAVSLFASSAVWDLSRDQRFSLSPASKEWLARNDNNLFVRLYYSPQTEIKERLADVLRLLEQYQLNSGNKLSLHTIEVAPLSPTEAEARKAGLRGGEGEPWFGLVVSDQNGRFATIPYLEAERRSYLEHDISRILSRLESYRKPTIGILSPELAIISSADALDYTTDWPFAAALRKDYNLRYIPADSANIPADVGLLLVVNPKGLSPLAVYAIDQYLMRGGSILMFMDPLSEVALAQAGEAANRSNLQNFLANIGIGYDDRKVAGDNIYNRRNYPFWINVVPSENAHPLLAGLKPLALNSPGWFRPAANAAPKPQLIFATSDNSGEVDVAYLQHASVLQTLENYAADRQSRPLAVLQEGEFTSLFSRPLVNDEKIPFLSVSIKPGKLMLVADSDILDSRLWNANSRPGQDAYDFVPFHGNLDFIERAADYLSGNAGLLNIPPRLAAVSPLPIASVLLLRTETDFAAAADETTRELTSVQEQQAAMQQQIKNQQLPPSLQTTKQLENLERSRLELVRRQQQIRAEIIKTYKFRLAVFMAFNFLLPLIIFLFLLAGFRLSRRRLAKQAERITDA